MIERAPTWDDLEETSITLEVYLDEWYPHLNASRCTIGDAQRRALQVVVWKHPPTYLAWDALVEFIAKAMDAAARVALKSPPSAGVERVQLGSGCVVHRVGAWGGGRAANEGPSSPLDKVKTLELFLKPWRRKPHPSHTHSLVRWRKRRAQLKRYRPAYTAMVWTAPPTIDAWYFVRDGLEAADDQAKYGAARRRARAAGKRPPTWEQLTERSRRIEAAAAKRAWTRYVAQHDAEKRSSRKKGARYG